jgi:acyl-CoA reductase-like NAD-dependent aldehyde dehydrogenase
MNRTERIDDAIRRTRARNGRPSNIPEDSLDFNNPVDRCAVYMHCAEYRPHDVEDLLGTAGGQVRMADAWARLDPVQRQARRRRAAELLDAGVSGSELRSRPEDNVA